MKRFLLWAALLLLINRAIVAAPCLPGTLQDYINLGSTGCQAGVVQLSSFQIEPIETGAVSISPAAVQVTPGGSSLNPAFLYTLNRTAAGGELLESDFRFHLTGPLSGTTISLIGASASGDGAVVGTIDLCREGMFAGTEPVGCTGTPESAIAFSISGDSQLTAATPFHTSGFFDVFVDLSIDGGLSGSASLNSAQLGIAAVPEPGSASLITAGVLLLMARRLFTHS